MILLEIGHINNSKNNIQEHRFDFALYKIKKIKNNIFIKILI
jgi:hypothetical protein